MVVVRTAVCGCPAVRQLAAVCGNNDDDDDDDDDKYGVQENR
jgi:hypothetical protein